MRPMVILSLLSICLVMGCSTIKHEQREMSLERTLDAYQKALRWGDFETVFALHKKTLDPQLLNQLKNVKITRYTESKRYSPSNDELYQVVDIYYYRQPSVTEAQLTAKQLWRYDESLKRWYIDNPIPQFLKK